MPERQQQWLLQSTCPARIKAWTKAWIRRRRDRCPCACSAIQVGVQYPVRIEKSTCKVSMCVCNDVTRIAGLQVGVLSFGFWRTFNDQKDQEAIDNAKACMTIVLDAGANLFDNAEVYGRPSGTAETILGEALQQLTSEDPKKWRRSDLVITTKLFWGGEGVNERGLSVKHLREGLDASLKRLQLDYVDLVFCHRADPLTPTETVVRGMTDLVRSGKATACAGWYRDHIPRAAAQVLPSYHASGHTLVTSTRAHDASRAYHADITPCASR